MALSTILKVYFIVDLISAPLSAIGWVYFWKYGKRALFIQRYHVLKLTHVAKDVPESTHAMLTMKQNFIAGFCGDRALADEMTEAILQFEGAILMSLVPALVFCTFAMFGFFLGGVLLALTNFQTGPSLRLLLYITLVDEVISCLAMLIGIFITLDPRLCATEYAFSLRTIVIGTGLGFLVIYKGYEVACIWSFMKDQTGSMGQVQVQLNGSSMNNTPGSQYRPTHRPSLTG